jgi:hypothetical protein
MVNAEAGKLRVKMANEVASLVKEVMLEKGLCS